MLVSSSWLCFRILWRRRRPGTWSAPSSRKDTNPARTDGSSRSWSFKLACYICVIPSTPALCIFSLEWQAIMFQRRKTASSWRREPHPLEWGATRRTLCAGGAARSPSTSRRRCAPPAASPLPRSGVLDGELWTRAQDYGDANNVIVSGPWRPRGGRQLAPAGWGILTSSAGGCLKSKLFCLDPRVTVWITCVQLVLVAS